MHVIMLSNACNHRYQVKKTPEEIEREIKAQEAELQKLLQESVGFVVFFRIANLCLFSNVSNFEKADCSIFALSVSRLVGVTINFFNIYRHTSLFLT